MNGDAQLLPHLLQGVGAPADGVRAPGEQVGGACAVLLPVNVAGREGQRLPVAPQRSRQPGAQALPPAEGQVLRILRHRPVHLGVRAVAHALERRGPQVLQRPRANWSASIRFSTQAMPAGAKHEPID